MTKGSRKIGSEKLPKPIGSVSDFAKYLGLSYCTVSRAINGHPLVNAKTRDRIFAAMDEIGFRPNPFARGLRGQGVGMIGVCFRGLNIPILNAKIFYLQEFLRKNRFKSLIEISDFDPESETRIVEDFLRIKVEGIVTIYSALDPAKARRLFRGIPCVHVDPCQPQEMPSAVLNRRKAMQCVFQHLFDLGHRSFGLLGISAADTWRWPALCESAQRCGLDPAQALIPVPRLSTTPESSFSEGRKLVEVLISRSSLPSAMIALDDQIAIGATLALEKAGVKVPRDVSIVGFDNLDIAREFHPALTTIDQRPHELMGLAVELLLHEIRLPVSQRGQSISRMSDPELVLGQSTAPKLI